jgi:CDP-glucose 4,6-dehydratase
MVGDLNFWSGKNVLVTGHTGFKGSWLCICLHRLGVNVSGLSLLEPVSTPDMFSKLGLDDYISNYPGDIFYPDICSNAINMSKPEILFHLAAQPLVRESYADPLKTYNTNVIGTANILEAARNCDSIKTIVVITTDKCYENFEKEYAYIETDQLGGYDPYSSSKACAEHIALAYYKSYFKGRNMGLATGRAGNVIGGGDWATHRLIPDAVKAWSKKEKLIIRNPQATRPWQHVLEPLSGYILLAQKLWDNPVEFSGAWNFGQDQNSIKTVNEILELAASEWGGDANWETSQKNHPHEAGLLQLNSDKARSLLGWEPRTNCKKGVIDTIKWYKKYYRDNPDMKEVTLNQIEEYENISIYT